MNTLDNYLQTATSGDAISRLRNGRQAKPISYTFGAEALDITKHRINDRNARRDKYNSIDIAEDDDLAGLQGREYSLHQNAQGERKAIVIDRVNRIALALQKRIVGSSVAFTFGNPTAYNASPRDEAEKTLAEVFNRIVRDCKLSSHDRRMARTLFAYGEVAELWHPITTDETQHYGINTPIKLRPYIISPEQGDSLYPYFDEYGDMLAFGREYYQRDGVGAENHTIFDAYTADYLYRWIDGTIAEGYPRPNPLGKIPVVYAWQGKHETHDVDKLIERLELLLSNFSDTNDYHASPKIFVKGQLLGFSRRGEAGAIIEGDEHSSAEYLSWSSAPEAVRLEIETLLKMIYSISQTPDISFDSVKGLGAMSGTALKLLFMDAHLKVQDKREILDEYLTRRISIIKRYIGVMDSRLKGSAESLSIEAEITPYIITSEQDDLNYWLTASGNKPLISHEEAIQRAGISHDPEATLQALTEESERANAIFYTQPTTI